MKPWMCAKFSPRFDRIPQIMRKYIGVKEKMRHWSQYYCKSGSNLARTHSVPATSQGGVAGLGLDR